VSVLLGVGQGSIHFARNFLAGNGAVAVAVADLTGDGTPDLVIANRYDNNVSVLPIGTESFPAGSHPSSVVVGQFAENFPTGINPNSVAVADINGDGIPDLIVANRSSDYLSVLPGKGNGSFLAAQDLAVGTGQLAVAVRDLGNGHLDIVTADFDDNMVSVLLGNGRGSFQTPLTFNVNFEPISIAVADLNGDGIPDIVTANYGVNDVSVLLGDGHGSFLPRSDFGVGYLPNSIVVADLNGDGIPDIITANYASNDVSVLLGDGRGSFLRAKAFPVGNHPFAVAVADLGNGHMDIVTPNAGDNTVTVLLGNGDGTFQSAEIFPVDQYPIAVTVADLGNGHPDIIIANGISNTVSVLLGDGHGSFQTHLDFPVGSKPQSIAVADLNGDGIPDIITGNYEGNDVTVLLDSGQVIPVHRAETVLLDLPSPPVFAPPLLSLSQPSGLAAAALTSATTSGTEQVPPPPGSSGKDVTIDFLSDLLAGRFDVLEFLTEQDILNDMDLISPLFAHTPPQANLVPQDMGALVTLRQGDPNNGATWKSESGRVGAKEERDVQPNLISPFENTMRGSSSLGGASRGRSSQRNPKRSDRGFDKPIKGSEDLLPAEGVRRAQVVPVPASVPTDQKGHEARGHLLTLTLLLSVLGQFICWPHGRARLHKRRENRVSTPSDIASTLKA
jgi:hypothetical protein